MFKFGLALSLSLLILAGCSPAPNLSPTQPRAPVANRSASQDPVTSASITISAPQTGAAVGSPVHVSGIARVFEGQVEFAVRDATGKVIGKGTALASAGAPEWGNFEADVAYEPVKSDQEGVVEAFSRSARDGSVQDLVSVKVVLSPQ